MSARFTRPEHLRKRADFQATFQAGVRLNGRYMTMVVRSTGEQRPARLGIAATRKIGGAVTRNRAKRVARELFRQQKPADGLDIVLVPHREFPNAPFASLEREFQHLLQRLRVSFADDSRTRRRGTNRPGVDSRL